MLRYFNVGHLWQTGALLLCCIIIVMMYYYHMHTLLSSLTHALTGVQIFSTFLRSRVINTLSVYINAFIKSIMRSVGPHLHSLFVFSGERDRRTVLRWIERESGMCLDARCVFEAVQLNDCQNFNN
jgi:hypothetical protein